MNNRIAVLISGRGSNLVSLLNASKNNFFPGSINLVISDNESAQGLSYAKEKGIRSEVANFSEFHNKKQFEFKLIDLISSPNIYIPIVAFFSLLVITFFVRSTFYEK